MFGRWSLHFFHFPACADSPLARLQLHCCLNFFPFLFCSLLLFLFCQRSFLVFHFPTCADSPLARLQLHCCLNFLFRIRSIIFELPSRCRSIFERTTLNSTVINAIQGRVARERTGRSRTVWWSLCLMFGRWSLHFFHFP